MSFSHFYKWLFGAKMFSVPFEKRAPRETQRRTNDNTTLEVSLERRPFNTSKSPI